MNILTGLQANNNLHIGNYFGAVLPMVKSFERLSADDKYFYFAPNLHSFTTNIDHTQLYQNTLNNIRLLLASGIPCDDTRVYLYRQSRIAAHSELAWALQCFTYYGEASRMTQFKDKSAKHQNFTVGLLTYPVLMAADILLYDAEYIPLGLDQKQHLELTRDICERFNNRFGQTFVLPKAWDEQMKYFQTGKGIKILSLSDPSKKMSKSDNDNKGCVFLEDKPEEAYKKIMSSATDSLSNVKYDPINQAGISNLLLILSFVREKSIELVEQEFLGQTQYGPFKKIVAQELADFLGEFNKNLESITDQQIENILLEHEEKTRQIANKKLAEVYKKLGL